MSRRAGTAIAFLIGAIACFWAFPTRADEALFARTDDLIRSFEYREAADLLSEFIRTNPPAAEELAARARLVRALASAGDEDAAIEAATALYERDPGYPVPTDERFSPRILAYYAQAAELAREAPPTQVRILVRPGTARIKMELSANTAALVSTAELWVRSERGTFENIAVTRVDADTPQYEAILEPALSIEYYARILAPSGYVVGSAGSSTDPLSWRNPFMAATPPPEPVAPTPHDPGSRGLPKWVVAGGIGLAVAGAAVGLLIWAPWSSDGPSLDARVDLP